MLRPRVGQKEPPRLGNTICYGQELARQSHRDSAVRFVTAKRGPERATKTRQYDLLRPNVAQKKLPRLGSSIRYCQDLARNSDRDSAVRFITAQISPEKAIKTRQYDLLRPNVGQYDCYGQELWPERATKTRQYDLLRPRVGQKKPPYDFLRPRVGQKELPRLGSTICYGQTWVRKSHQDSAVRFVTAKRGSEKATKTRQYDLLRPRVGQKKPPKLGSTICYGQTWARKSHRDSEARFVAAKRGPETTTKTRQYDLLRPRVGQKKPPRLGSTICYGQDLSRKSHHDSAVRFVTTKTWLEKATESHQDSAALFPNVGELARKSHQDSAVQFVTAKRGPEKATKTRY